MKKTIKKSQPKPPVKKYTAQDSAQYEAIGKRLDKNIQLFNKAPVKNIGGMQFKSGLDVDHIPTMRAQLDSMARNPYFPTAKARAEAAKAKSGGMKSTKPAPAKSVSKSNIKSKMTESGVAKMKMKTPSKNYKK